MTRLATLILAMVVPTLGRDSAIGQDSTSAIKAMFESGSAVTGFIDRGEAYCDPYSGSEAELMAKYEPLYNVAQIDSSATTAIAVFPADTLPEPMLSDLGDTLIMVWSGGTTTVTVDAVCYFGYPCQEGVAYRLAPVDSSVVFSRGGNAVLVFRDFRYSSTMVRAYKPYVIHDTSLKRWADSAVAELAAWYAQYDYDGRGLERTSVEHIGALQDSVPDTLFQLVNGVGWPSEWFPEAIHTLVRAGAGWRRETVVGPRKGSSVFRIHATFDLDGDGVLEYLVDHNSRAGLWHFSDGKLTPIYLGRYRGC